MPEVLRLIRHPADEAQAAALRHGAAHLLGCEEAEVGIVQVSATVTSVEEVAALVREAGAAALEAVLPLPLMAQVVPLLPKEGVPVLRAITERILGEDGSATFRFDHYEVVEDVKVVTRSLPLP
jgi:hypothetical protein